MSPKELAQKNYSEAEEQAVKSLEGIQEQLEESQVQAEEPTMEPLNEVLGQVESAYASYVDAQRQVSKIYKDGTKMMVCGDDALMGRPVQIAADLVVLATGIDPSDGVVELAQTLNISYDTNRFLVEAHPKLRPVETQTSGIFLAGVAVALKGLADDDDSI